MSERSIFLAALDIADPAQRLAYLNQVCGDDYKLRAHIDELIAAEGKLGGFLAQPHSVTQATADFASASERPGTVIGPYKLLQQIGEGGFGIVYMAEQQRPVRRKVALKIIKPGMDTREVIARFEAERQALALMEHPNIARVLDGGTTESGRPYFVMELVKGIPLTQFCDDNKLDMRQRLALFSAVCKAIQHAHHKGVIHRDIKPSNVMVTLHDGQPVPKVIDFGVSKAISQQLTEKTMFTAYGQMIGTPAYMSPEQAEMSGLDIDTRSDVYSLGVLLYELLTGSTPLEAKSLRGKAYAELQRMIREDEPPRPSLRVSTRGEATALIAAQRSTGPRELGAVLRGELDWIVMKALEKNRDRRYESANTFAADVERYLRHEAVEACPPSALYRTRKFIRRNRIACTTGSLVALSLLGGILFSALAARDALYQRRLAENSLRVAFADRQATEQAQKNTVAALQVAERERDRAEKSKDEESKQLQIANEREAEARAARQEEAAQRAAAEEERDKANALNAELAKQKEQQRRMLYVAQINLIQKAWDSDNTERVRELLNATRPRPGEQDLRSFEWNYWQRMLHGEERTLQLPLGPSSERKTVTAAVSHDGQYVAAVTGTSPRIVRVWETGSGKQRFEKQVIPEVLVPSGASGTLGSASHVAIGYVDSERIALVMKEYETTPDRSDQWVGTARLQVFRFDTGEETFSMEVPNQPLAESFVFSRDGSRVAASLAEPFVQIWNIHSVAEVAQVVVPSREGAIRIGELLTLSPDGSRLAVKPSVRLATGTEPFGITIAEVGTDKTVTTPSIRAQKLEFSPDGSRIVAMNSNAMIRNESRVTVFNATTGSQLYELVHIAPALSETTTDVRSHPLRFSSDGKWLAFTSGAGYGNSALQLWNAATGDAGPKFKGHTSTPLQVAFSADGRQFISVHESGAIMFWPLPLTEPPLDRNILNERLGGTIFKSPDGRWTASAPPLPADPSRTESTLNEEPEPIPLQLKIQDTSGRIADRFFPLSGRFGFARFSSNGAFVLAGSVNDKGENEKAGELKVWEMATGRELISIRTDTTLLSSAGVFRRFLLASNAFSPDNQRLAIAVRAGTENGRPKVLIHVWDLTSGRELLSNDQQPVKTSIHNGLEFNTSGDLLLSVPKTEPSIVLGIAQGILSSSERRLGAGIQVWDAATGQLRWEEHSPSSAVISPDGSCIAGIVSNSNAGGGQSHNIVVWNSRTGTEIGKLPLPDSWTGSGFDVNADGSRLILASGREAAVYDTVLGHQLFALQGHSGNLRAMVFSSDGQRIATTAGYGTPTTINPNTEEARETKIWDAVTGQELLSLKRASPTSLFGFNIGAGRELTPHFLITTPDQSWDAAPLSAKTEAEELVRWLATVHIGGRIPTRGELTSKIEVDPSISEPTRTAAQRLVQDGARDAEPLLRACWEIVKQADLPAENYQWALELAEEACAVDPSFPASFNSRGAAYYRLGQYDKALADLERTPQGPESEKLAAVPTNLILLALTHHQLGQTDQAIVYLAKFDHFRYPQNSNNLFANRSAWRGHTHMLRKEATALLGVAE